MVTAGCSGNAAGMDDTVIDGLQVAAYTVPTEQPESDGTLAWDSTTMVVVRARGGGREGIGYSYTHAAAAALVRDKLAGLVSGRSALDVAGAWAAMVHGLRNFGTEGLGMMAVSAVDVALWDLKARLLEVPMAVALDAVHERVPIYGSGGFTSYSLAEIRDQLTGWVQAGIDRVKIKVGREPAADPARLTAAREAIGPDVELFVDANGAFTRAQARYWAHRYVADYDVRWFEEPVSSDDLDGLRAVRAAGPGGLDVAAGEYGWTPWYFRRMLAADAVDCLQADVTRCGGFTGFRAVGALCEAHCMDLSAHCAPQLSAQACVAVRRLRHLEYFHDHNRIEHLLLDGCLEPSDSALVPDRGRVGLGLALREADAERYRVS